MRSRRARWIVYLSVVHALAAVALGWLLRETPAWILLVEASMIVSLLVGLRLVRAVFEPLEVLRAATDLMESRDFASRFQESGNPEMDGLVRVYNRMAAELRSERVRNEEQETFLQRILAASATGVITLDLDGQVASASPSVLRLIGDRTSLRVLAGRALGDIDTPLTRGLAPIANGDAAVLQLPGRRRVRAFRGQFLDRGFARDFFVLDELTEELRQTERLAYEKLIRTMSHEVNNTAGGVTSLLDSCLTYAEQIRDEDRSDFRSALDVASARTTRLNDFVRAFADVVRLPAPERETVPMTPLLDQLERFVGEECAERRIRIVREGTADRDEVHADPAQLERALVNVLRNAIDAIGEDGEILISWSGGRDSRVLAVSDSGSGISLEVEPHLFEPFYSSKSGGRGVGLTLVQEILDGHGLSFSLTNHDDETGAVFRVWFP